MPLITAYDGITVQVVGELYTGDQTTRRLHRRASHTYLRALSDLAFGIVLCEQIVLPKTYPRYVTSRQAPGHDLHLLLLRRNEGMFARTTPPEKSEVASARPGELVPTQIQAAARRSLIDERLLWQDFVLREFTTYFPASEHYQECDIGLEASQILDLFGCLRAELAVPIDDRQLVQFVKRCVGAHILIDFKTSTLDWKLPGRVVRLPHATRADVHLERLQWLGGGPAAENIRRWIQPQVLGHALIKHGQTPTEFFEELLELREKQPFRDMRAKLTAGVAEWEERGTTVELDSLARNVEQVATECEVEPNTGKYARPGVLENAEFLSDIFKFRWLEVYERLKWVFPTLREEGTVDKSIHIGEAKGSIVSTGDQVAITSNVLAFQEWATGTSDVQESLAAQLAVLREQVGTQAPSLERDRTLGQLAEAEDAARNGVWGRVGEALSKVGKKLYDAALQAGLELAAKAIAKAAGIQV